MSADPKASDLVRARFAVTDGGIYVERHGRPVRGQRPDWLDWPSVRGDEFGPPPESHADLAAASKARRAK